MEQQYFTTFPASLDKKRAWNLQELCQYTGWSESYAYKLHMAGKIPGASKPCGKIIFFDSEKVIQWLLANPQKTAEQIETEAATRVALGA